MMKELHKRATIVAENTFHKYACSCLTRCICGCTGTGNAGNLNWVEQQVRVNQKASGVANNY